MARWTSFALLAATALVAAPVGTHYLSQDKPTEARAVNGSAATAASRAAAAISEAHPSAAEKAGENSKLQTLEEDAVEGAKLDLATTVCAFAAEPVDRATHGCRPEAISSLDVMIAILPDPVHTQMALRFDRGIDSLEDELGQLGWVYDRSWLPWENTGHNAADRWQDRRTDDHLQHSIESLPGVVLFRQRSPDQERRALAVLVVGDTPTGGVNATQFSRAMQLWQQPCDLVHAKCAPSQPPKLAIFGPTFSGSLPSLHSLLYESLSHTVCGTKDHVSIMVTSGTVSDAQTLEADPFSSCAAVALQQESFAVDTGYLAEHLAQFEPHRRFDASRIAHLSERETSFGGRDVSSFVQTRLTSYQRYKQTLDCNVTKVLCVEVDESIARLQRRIPSVTKHEIGDHTPVTNLTFPRGISRLRKAYEQNGIIGFAEQSDAPHTQLQMSSAGNDRNDDTMPSYAGNLYTLSMEADMASLAHTLVRERYSVVLLSASDVMDEIFVARYLAQHAPDLTVVISDADELFLREGQDMSLQNTYTVSVWPLMERNISWTSSSPRDVQVPTSSSDEGSASALHYLVCASVLTGDQPACSADSYREYRPPFLVDGASNDNKLQPPLWLSIVGHSEFLPVSLIDLDDTRKQLPESNALSLPRLQEVSHDSDGAELSAPFTGVNVAEYTSLPTKLIAGFIVGLLIWHGAACVICRLDRPFAWTYARAERQHDVLRLLVKAGLSILGTFALAILYIPTQQPPPGTEFRTQSAPFHLLLILGEVLGAAVSSLSIWTAVQVHLARRKRNRARRSATIAACIYFGVLVLTMGLLHWTLLPAFAPSGKFPTERLFFLYRSSVPFSGASPVLPLLLMSAAAAVWVHGIFAQLAFFGHRIPKLPDGFEHLRCPPQQAVTSLNDLLSTRFSIRRLIQFLLCIAGAVLMMSLIPGHAGIQSFSHGPFDQWITVATLLFSATILQDLTTASRAWGKLRHQVLIPLKQSPLRWGFTWVKGFSWRRIWTASNNLSSNQVFDYLLRLLETDHRDPVDPNVDTCYKSVYSHYHLDPKPDDWTEEFTSRVEALHASVKKAAAKRLIHLQDEWKKDAGPLTGTEEIRGLHMLQKLEDVKEDSGSSSTGRSREDRLKRMGSEEFVALLYIGYITAVLVQIRHRIIRAAVVYILMMWALTSYPWMYRHTILLELSALLIVLAFVTISIYSQMHRDDILSRTTETETGKLDSGFFEKVIPIVGVPLLSLIASQFPEFSNLIFSWIQPGLSHMQ